MDLSEKRAQAGRMGGLATLRRHGRGHMQAIGKKGAAALWALVSRSTGEVKAMWF